MNKRFQKERKMLLKSFIIYYIYTVVLVTFSPYVESFRTRLINGENAEQSDFKYHVSVQSNGEHLCGGAIISDQFVLTAAHCFFKDGKMGASKKTLTVKSGTNRLSGTGFVNEIENVMILLDYMDIFSHNHHNLMDIAVIKLQDKLTFDDYYVQKINLPEEHESRPLPGETVTIAGYGYTEEAHIYYEGNETRVNGSLPDVLKTMQTQVMSCRDYYSTGYDEKHICTYKPRDDDDQNRYGECYGDSGSPLAYDNTVVGIVSSGAPLCGDRNIPNIYTKVSFYMDFIRDAMSLKRSDRIVNFKKSHQGGHYYWS